MVTDKQLSPIGGSSVPVPNRMLRLLKKATSISDLCPGSDGGDLGEDGLLSAKGLGGVEEEEGTRMGVEDGVNARKALDFDSVPEINPVVDDLDEKGEEVISDLETREETRVLESFVPEIDPVSEELGEKNEVEIPGLETRVWESSESEESGEIGEDGDSEMETEEEINGWGAKGVRKKRKVLEASDSQGKEKKRNNKRSKKTVDFDELPTSTASMNMTKKERREYLDQLRAENQRLLRETREAAFEPVPLVRKPISSVLEKIRRRKEEISKQFLSRKKSMSKDIDDGLFGEDVNDFEDVVMEEKNEASKQTPDVQDSAGPLGNSDSPSNKKSESNSTHQDPSLSSQTANSGEELLEKTSTRSVKEVITPSVLPKNLNRIPSPAPDNSEEAEYTKESYDSETQDSSPGDPVRKFIDEVAEEEDDSDNDLLRFEDDDDEDEDEEDDDLRDMIASQFKEDPSDKDKRNELHQKWLEQQDAAGTEKLLHKLKRGMQQDKTSLFENEDRDDDADDDEEVTKPEASEDENEEDPSHATSMRMRIKKIKEMMPLMFTDKDDVYVSSDDEETEKKLMQQRLYEKRLEQKAKFSSSTGDEEEVLRHIKKPEIGKKAKPTSFKDRALMGINKNPAASMSSFLGKHTKSSISEGSRKRGSNVVRGYIFERDDSNSKSLNSVPEEPSVPQTVVQEKSRPRRAPAKFTASQSQERSTTSQGTPAEEEKSPMQRTTLYEILKMSSKKSSFTSGETVISSSYTESILAAFKLDKKPQGKR